MISTFQRRIGAHQDGRRKEAENLSGAVHSEWTSHCRGPQETGSSQWILVATNDPIASSAPKTIPNATTTDTQFEGIRPSRWIPIHDPISVLLHDQFVSFTENPKVLILDVATQAGTYIKEMVHGEFGRTSPSISSIIGQEIDIVALDVNAIDLDWPKEIDNKASVGEAEEN